MTSENESGVHRGVPAEGEHMRYFPITMINAKTKVSYKGEGLGLVVPEG